MRKALSFIAILFGAGCGSAGSDTVAPRVENAVHPAVVIDEPDLYKRDGSILYVQNAATGLNVVDLADPMKPRLAGRAAVTGGSGAEIYLQPGNLVVVMLKSATDKCRPLAGLDARGWKNDAEVALVDAREKTQPVLLGRHCLPGSLVHSRTVDGTLFAVLTNPDVDRGGSRAVSISLADPRSPAVVAQQVFAGAGREITLTPEWLVVAGLSPNSDVETRVQFLSISPDGQMKARGSLGVSGAPQGRFHQDLRGNLFRIVTFETNRNSSRLTTIDFSDADRPFTLSVLPNIAPGERLEATRFEGDRAYVVTFFERVARTNWGTDPLWVISLKDPKQPEILGELIIPGWSEFVFPRGNRLVGIGRGDNGLRIGVSLIDVGDPTAPAELDQVELGTGGASSEANVDHRGITIVEDGNRPFAVVPFSNASWTTDAAQRRLCTVKSFLQIVDIDTFDLTLRGRGEHTGSVRRSFMDGADKLVAFSDYEIKGLLMTQGRDVLEPGAALTLGNAESLEASVREVCEEDLARQPVFGCTVSGDAPAKSGWATPLLVLGAALLSGRRRRQ